ncbi:hypothetical protein D3C72_1698950 [compost metagenome]
MLRHGGGRHEIFLDVVEAAAMHLPFFAIGADGQMCALHQTEVECDEIEGRADPGDGGDDVEPADGKGHPFPRNGIFVHSVPLILVQRTLREI